MDAVVIGVCPPALEFRAHAARTAASSGVDVGVDSPGKADKMKNHENLWKRRSVRLGALCVLSWMAFAVGKARAGSVELLVTESGGPLIPITDNGALDVDGGGTPAR